MNVFIILQKRDTPKMGSFIEPLKFESGALLTFASEPQAENYIRNYYSQSSGFTFAIVSLSEAKFKQP